MTAPRSALVPVQAKSASLEDAMLRALMEKRETPTVPAPVDPLEEALIGELTRKSGAPPMPTRLGTTEWHRGGGALRGWQPGDFFLGYQESNEPLGIGDDRHVLIVGGARGGKGASLLVPNLSLHPGSVVVIDPKGENAMVTARRRAGGSPWCEGLGQRVFILDPFRAVRRPEDDFQDLRASFNPLDLIHPDDPESVDHAARIAESMVVAEVATADPFWKEAPQALIKALILHVASSPAYDGRRNLLSVRKALMEGDPLGRIIAEASGGEKAKVSGQALLFAAMKRSKAFGGVVAHHGSMLADLEEKAARTMSNVAQIACTHTEFLESAGMRECLSRSDFELSDLKTDPRGVSLYLTLPQRYMGTHYRYLRMMAALVIGEMERHRQQPASGHRVLLMLDEFPALKRMAVIENAAAQIAGFGVRMVFAAQTLAQLREIYRDNWETFVANAGVKLFFVNDDHFTRDYASKLVGECEIVKVVRSASESQGGSSGSSRTEGFSSSIGHSVNHSQGSGGGSGSSLGFSDSLSRSVSDTTNNGSTWSRTKGWSETIHKRPLATPDEIGRLFGLRENPTALAIVSGYQPIFLRRGMYFRGTWLLGKYDWHADHARPVPIREVPALVKRIRAEAARRIAEEEERERDAKYWAERRIMVREALERRRIEQQEAERLRRGEQEIQKQLAARAERRQSQAVMASIGAVVFGLVLSVVWKVSGGSWFACIAASCLMLWPVAWYVTRD